MQSIDDAAYTVHFVLNALRSHDLSELFAGTTPYSQLHLETKLVRKNIYNLMYLYTKSLLDDKECDLRNHISYWLVISTLIERDMMAEID